MAKDLTIRELGRPQVSADSQMGFQKLVRKYVVQGDRASKSEIESTTNPLFLSVGTSDEEFTNHYLTNQQLQPASGDMDRAYLTREFIELRNNFFSESTSQSNDLIRVNRKYVVLRSNDPTHGYGELWNYHPNNPDISSYNSSVSPWAYAPPKVTTGEPGQITTYNYSTVTSDSGFSTMPSVSIGGSSSSLQDYLTNTVGTTGLGKWVRGKASVIQYLPGVDVWDVEWVTHTDPYWSIGTAKGASSRSIPLTLVDFDGNGLMVSQYGLAGSSSVTTVARTFVTYHVGENIPNELINITGGTDNSFLTSTVNVDVSIKTTENRVITINKFLRNAVFKVTGTGGDHGLVIDGKTVGQRTKFNIIFDYESTIKDAVSYQIYKAVKLGGQITWTRAHIAATENGSTIFGSAASKITPLFSHGKTKIYKVESTYIG